MNLDDNSAVPAVPTHHPILANCGSEPVFVLPCDTTTLDCTSTLASDGMLSSLASVVEGTPADFRSSKRYVVHCGKYTLRRPKALVSPCVPSAPFSALTASTNLTNMGEAPCTRDQGPPTVEVLPAELPSCSAGSRTQPVGENSTDGVSSSKGRSKSVFTAAKAVIRRHFSQPTTSSMSMGRTDCVSVASSSCCTFCQMATAPEAKSPHKASQSTSVTTTTTTFVTPSARRLKPPHVVFECERFIVIWDKKPVSKYHFLVIPRQHYPNVKFLTEKHLEVVQEMASVGRYLLLERMVADLVGSACCGLQPKKIMEATKSPPATILQPLSSNLQPPLAEDLCVGFHVSPFHSVDHLHLHCIAPASQMGFLDRTVNFRVPWVFASVDSVLAQLKHHRARQQGPHPQASSVSPVVAFGVGGTNLTYSEQSTA